MTQMNKDILRNPEMRKTPYSVPEGYFDNLKVKARKYAEPHQAPVNIWSRLAPYAGIAAMFLFILALGKTFVGSNASISADISEEKIAVINEDYEDYLVFSDIDVTDVRYSGEDVNEPDEMNDEEIVEYLIYIGATERYIESNKE